MFFYSEMLIGSSRLEFLPTESQINPRILQMNVFFLYPMSFPNKIDVMLLAVDMETERSSCVQKAEANF